MATIFADSLDLTGVCFPASGVRVGVITDITPEGRARVDYPGNPLGPTEARAVITLPAASGYEGTPVLLFFEDGNAALPIIVGIVRDTVLAPAAPQQATLLAEVPRKVVCDGKRVVLDAAEEMLLRCGKGSITLRKDGKIVVRGTELVSRASGVQKIKGAAVKIN